MENVENSKYNFSDKVVENIFRSLSLICFGIVLLLNTTGIVGWEMWQYVFIIFIYTWPLFLIFAGLQIISRNSLILNIIFNLRILLTLLITKNKIILLKLIFEFFYLNLMMRYIKYKQSILNILLLYS